MPWMPRSTLVGKLREHRPDHLVVFCADDDEPTRINCLTVRNWAQRVMKTLAELRWDRLELRDKKGGLLVKHERGPEDDPPPTELEGLAPTREVSSATGFLSLVLKAQDLVLQRHNATIQPVIDVLFKLVDVSMRRLDLSEKQYEHALKVNGQLTNDLMRAHAAAARGNAAEEESLSGGMVESLLPAIVESVMDRSDEPRQRERERERPRDRRDARKANESAGAGPASHRESRPSGRTQ
ncbi:MAG: hypothetical protein ACTHU0_39200 [Kofleriaceae bacterium]